MSCTVPRPMFKGQEFKDRVGIVGSLSARGQGEDPIKRKYILHVYDRIFAKF